MKFNLIFALLLFALTSATARAEAYPSIICGGNVGGKDLTFRINPLTSVASAQDEEERLIFYIDLSKPERVKVTFAEVLRDDEWESLRQLREKQAPEMARLLKRVGAARIQEIWMGWSPGGFVHMESSQGGFTFSVSCQKTEQPSSNQSASSLR